jgi:hypothetical protein
LRGLRHTRQSDRMRSDDAQFRHDRSRLAPPCGQGDRIWLKTRLSILLAAILRDGRLRRPPQDEDFFRGKISDRHGEGAAKPRVSNHEARYNPGFEKPYADPALVGERDKFSGGLRGRPSRRRCAAPQDDDLFRSRTLTVRRRLGSLLTMRIEAFRHEESPHPEEPRSGVSKDGRQAAAQTSFEPYAIALPAKGRRAHRIFVGSFPADNRQHGQTLQHEGVKP